MKKRIIVFLMILTLVIGTVSMTGCGEKKVTVTDRSGSEVVIGDNLERIISTAPSNTEILVGLGLGDKIVAVDKYSDLEGLNSDVTIIDFRSPDAEVIVGLEPDILIVSGHNKAGTEDPFAVIKEAGIPVVSIPSADSIGGIYKDIEFIASITDTDEKGDAMVDGMKKEIEEVKAISDTIENKKTVYFEISPAPHIYTTGNGTFQNEILSLVGGMNIFEEASGWISPSAESIIEMNPQVILTNVNYVEGAVDEIKTREGFNEIEAVKSNNVYLIDGNASSRPSQHVIKAIKEIAKAVYPEYYE